MQQNFKSGIGCFLLKCTLGVVVNSGHLALVLPFLSLLSVYFLTKICCVTSKAEILHSSFLSSHLCYHYRQTQFSFFSPHFFSALTCQHYFLRTLILTFWFKARSTWRFFRNKTQLMAVVDHEKAITNDVHVNELIRVIL